jgi:hypothetical protein
VYIYTQGDGWTAPQEPTAMTNLTFEFNTATYEFSHGRTPRGRGSWAFGTRRNPDVMNPRECFFSPGELTLAEAKKWVRQHVALMGVQGKVTLFVLP